MNKKGYVILKKCRGKKRWNIVFIAQAIFEILEYYSKHYRKIIINLRKNFSLGPEFKPWSPALKRDFITKEIESKNKKK